MLAPIFVGLWSWLSLPFQCMWAGVQRRNRLVDDRILELCGAYSDERIRLAYNVKERSERTGSGDYADRELQIMRLVTDAAPSAGEKEMPAAPSAGEEELPEIELTPQGASEEDIDLCGRKITLKHRFYGMGLLGGICVLFQAVALVPTVRWADIENETGGRRRKLQSCGSATFVAISSSECPSNSDLGNCYDSVACGELCEGDSECGTTNNLDNCGGGYDVYRRDCPISTDGKFVYVSQNMYWSDCLLYTSPSPRD